MAGQAGSIERFGAASGGRPDDGAAGAGAADTGAGALPGPRAEAGPMPPPGPDAPSPSGGRKPRHPRAGRTAGALLCALATVVALGLAGVSAAGTRVAERAARAAGTVAPGATGTTGPAPRNVTRITADDLRQLAEAQTRALRERDAEAFTAPYDHADSALLAERRRLFANLVAIPFDQAEFRADPRAAAEARGDGPLTTSAWMSFSHRVAGVDAAPTAERYRFTVTRDRPGAPLTVTAVDGGPSRFANPTHPEPWDTAELVVVTGPRVVLVTDRGHERDARTWAARAESAAARNAAAWKGAAPVASRYIVYVTPDRATFDGFRESAGGRVTTGAVGVCLSLPADPDLPPAPGGSYLAASRIVIDSTSDDFAPGDSADQIALLRHEMGHAMVAGHQVRGQAPPLWVSEGFAGLLEWADRSLERWYVPAARDLVRSGGFSGRLPADAEIYSSDAGTSGAAYHFAMLAVRFVAERHGAARAHDMVVAIYRDPSAAGVEAAVLAATGLTMDQFTSAWARFVGTTNRA